MSDTQPTSRGPSSSPGGGGPVDPRGVLLPPPPPPGYNPGYMPGYAPPPKGRGIVSRVLGGLVASVLLFSIALNVYLGGILFSMTTGPTEGPYRDGSGKHRIVILPIKGTIADEMAGFVHDSLKALDKNPPAAIVLRVESGGGGVVASDQIWHDLDRYRSAHPGVPIVASFGAVAASGGYYVATPAQHIFCEQTGITGSIGVMAQIPTMGGLMDKIGVEWVTLEAQGSPRKTVANDLYRDWTDEDKAAFGPFLDQAYQRFTQVVVQGRPSLTPEQLAEATTGEAFTADRAKAIGLIDDIGYLDDAIAHATQLAGVPGGVTPKVTILQRPRQFGIGGLLGQRHAGALPDLSAESISTTLTDLSAPRLMYLTRWR